MFERMQKAEAFKLAMLQKLLENEHKKPWENLNREQLMFFIVQELKELAEALEGGTPEEVRRECADVANFAMMIADNFGDLP